MVGSQIDIRIGHMQNTRQN